MRHDCKKNVTRHRRNRRREYWIKLRAERKRGPLGECIAEYSDGVLCVFKAAEVLAWADKQPHARPCEVTS